MPKGNYTEVESEPSTAELPDEGNPTEIVDPIHTNKYVLPFEQPAENWPVYTRRPVCQKNTAKIMPLPARDSLTAMVLTRRREETGFIERIAAHAEYRVSGFRRSSETVFTVSGNSFHSHSEKTCLSRNLVGRRVCPGQFNRRRKPIAAAMATRGSSKRTTGMMPAANVRRDGMGKPGNHGNHGLTQGNHLGVPRWSRSSGLTNRSSASKCPRKCH